jgi:hypothetical protein
VKVVSSLHPGYIAFEINYTYIIYYVQMRLRLKNYSTPTEDVARRLKDCQYQVLDKSHSGNGSLSVYTQKRLEELEECRKKQLEEIIIIFPD